jgi:hypothetical protein
MFTSLKNLVVTLSAVALVAGCSGTSLTGSSTAPAGTSTAAKITVTATPGSISSDGTVTANIVASVEDANNNLVSGAVVTFTATAGALAITTGTTSTNGQASATLSANGAAAGTSITVTAAVGTVSGNVMVPVVATTETLTLATSAPQIPSDGSKAATITALLKDANNNVLPNVAVQFTASSGGLTVTQSTTNQNGQASATLNAGGDPTNRVITVNASGGTATMVSLPVSVTGTTLALTGPSNAVLGTTGTYAIQLTDAGGNGISNVTVTLASKAGNTLSSPTATTNFAGQASVQVTATQAGNDTLSAMALGMSAVQAIAVSSQNFTISAPAANTKIPLGNVVTVTATWTVNGTAQVGQTVNFSATRGTLSAASAVTNASGNASVTISSTTSGPAVLSATGTGVTAQQNVDFIATVPASVKVQATPATVAVQGQSTILAVVRDAQNNLVEGQTVDFNLTDTTGGQLSVASAVTDDQGRAQTVYTASSTTSAANGVSIQATVQGTAVSGTTTLTVGGQTVFLSLGTGNTIAAESAAQYAQPWAVQALDAQGNAVNNVTITLAVQSLEYRKGALAFCSPPGVWDYADSCAPPQAPATTTCPSEDLNNNGILDPGEDFNNNGKLDPGNVAAVSPPSGQTSVDGSLVVNVVYPKDHAKWVRVRLIATATVQGTQSSTSADFWLEGLAADYSSQTIGPPGEVSPYGVANSCANPN